MRTHHAARFARPLLLAGWYAACLILAVPWWLVLAPAWTLFAPLALMTAAVFLPGEEQLHRRRGALLWCVGSILLTISLVLLALPGD